MVGAEVVVVKSGTEKCEGPYGGLRGIISSISENCFYISREKMVVSSAVSRTVPGSASVGDLDNTTWLPTISSTDSSASSTGSFVEQKHQHLTTTTSKVAGQCNTTLEEGSTAVGVKSAGFVSEPSVTSINTLTKGKKVLTWVKAVVVQRIPKSTCVLGVFLPRSHHDAGKDIGAAGDQDRICLLHGSQHMLFATRTLT